MNDPMVDYTAWLIELNYSTGPVYHQFKMDDDWTGDHNEACHFSRKQDAEQVIAYYGWTSAKAVEHSWPELRTNDHRSVIGLIHRIEALEAALQYATRYNKQLEATLAARAATLRDIASSVAVSSEGMRLLASEALDAGIGCGKSVIEPWNDK